MSPFAYKAVYVGLIIVILITLWLLLETAKHVMRLRVLKATRVREERLTPLQEDPECWGFPERGESDGRTRLLAYGRTPEEVEEFRPVTKAEASRIINRYFNRH